MERNAIQRFADLLLDRLVPRLAVGACPCGDVYQGNCCGCEGCPIGTTPVYRISCDCSTRWKIACDPYWQCL
jgi:hypothetical protein